jgi:P pilus assembly chaperone PapD
MSMNAIRLVLLCAVVALMTACGSSVEAAGTCAPGDTRIVVDTSKHRLALCEKRS